jgi:hypothetical protein
MNYLKLKEGMKEIVSIAESVPDKFKEKCFEILLNHFFAEGKLFEQKVDATSFASSEAIPISTQIKLFMKKTKIVEDDLKKILMYSDKDIHFIKEPTIKSPARGQMQWALLLALKNGFLKNELSVDPEDIRSICQEKKYYDKANFAKTFKNKQNASLFKGELKPQGKVQKLSNEGFTKLAELIKSLASD